MRCLSAKSWRIRLSNQCVSIAALFTIIHIISILIVPSSPYEFYISFSWLTIFSTTLVLNYKGLHNRANTFPIVLAMLQVGIKYNNNAPIVRIDCKRNLMAYVIEVSNNGIGIPETYHEEVFVMFKRLEQLKDKKGTGLGLSISKKLAQKYDAELNIVSSSESEALHSDLQYLSTYLY